MEEGAPDVFNFSSISGNERKRPSSPSEHHPSEGEKSQELSAKAGLSQSEATGDSNGDKESLVGGATAHGERIARFRAHGNADSDDSGYQDVTLPGGLSLQKTINGSTEEKLDGKNTEWDSGEDPSSTSSVVVVELDKSTTSSATSVKSASSRMGLRLNLNLASPKGQHRSGACDDSSVLMKSASLSEFVTPVETPSMLSFVTTPMFSPTSSRLFANADAFHTPTYAKMRHFAQSPVRQFSRVVIGSDPYMSPLLASDDLLSNLCPIHFLVCIIVIIIVVIFIICYNIREYL